MKFIFKTYIILEYYYRYYIYFRIFLRLELIYLFDTRKLREN